jgi:shikimate kinase
MRLFIVGFMCSGKSVTGRELARLTGRRFIDLDRAIEQRIGPILPWMQRHGEAAFRAEETQVLDELLHEEDVLVACGGGTPMAADEHATRMLAAGSGGLFGSMSRFKLVLQRRARARGRRSGPCCFGLRGIAAMRGPDGRTAGGARARTTAWRIIGIDSG